MNPFKHSLRLLIATSSVLGFLGGWILLAHAGKPAQDTAPAIGVAPAPIPTLPPLPDLKSPSAQIPQVPQIQALPILPQPQVSLPRFRTRGS